VIVGEKLPTVNDRNGECLWGRNGERIRVALANGWQKSIVKAAERTKRA